MPKFFSRQGSGSEASEPEGNEPESNEPEANEPEDLIEPESPAVESPAEESDIADDENGEWLAYELHPWSSHARTMLEGVLTSEKVPHSWQGTTLLAHHTFEEAVDDLIEDVSMADNPRLDPDEPTVAFEMQGWSGELIQSLTDRLGQAGIAHEFDDEGDLVVQESSDEHVDAIIDDVLASHEEEDLVELGGLEVNELLSSVFVACDRLRRDSNSSDGITAAVTQGRRLADVRTPFGFDGAVWRSLRHRAGLLADLLEGVDLEVEEVQAATGVELSEDLDDHERDDLITVLAQQLRDDLQKMI